MQRVTLTLDDDLLAALDALSARRGYHNRSEAVRDMLRDALNPVSYTHLDVYKRQPWSSGRYSKR